MESGKIMREMDGESIKTKIQDIDMQETGNRIENGDMVDKVL